MRTIALLFFCACGGTQVAPAVNGSGSDSVETQTGPEPMTRTHACGEVPELHLFGAPSYSLLHGSFAHAFGSRLAITYVGSGHHQRRVPVGQVAGFQGALYDATTSTWRDVPAPPESVLPRGPSANVHWVASADRIAMLVYSSARPRFGGTGASGAVLDLENLTWRELRGEGPPRDAFLTGPYRAGTTDRYWVWWPSHDGGANYAAGWVLDFVEARWSRASAEGAPTVRSFSRPRTLPDGRLLVIPVRSEIGGIFDPENDRWDAFEVPTSTAGYESVVVSEGGRWAAIMHFEESGPGQRRIRGYLLDLQSKAVEALPVPDATLGFHPNTQMLHVDAARIVYVNERTMHVFDRRMRRWSESPLPFENPVTNTGAFIELCNGRVLAEHHEHLLDLEAMEWRRLIWPEERSPYVTTHPLRRRSHVAGRRRAARNRRDPLPTGCSLHGAADRAHRSPAVVRGAATRRALIRDTLPKCAARS